MKKICVVTGTRAEYGILKPLMKEINRSRKLDLKIIVTGMHLSDEFGNSLKEIEEDGFEVDAKVDLKINNKNTYDMAKCVGKGVELMTGALRKINPDILLVLGDRSEVFSAVISAFHIGIPIVHIHGGDIGIGGRIDESLRHAITKLSHIHLTATKKSAERVLKLGEEAWRIHVIGSLSIDSIINEDLPTREAMERKYGIEMHMPFFIVLVHPLLVDIENAENQMEKIMKAVTIMKIPSIVIYPNSDAGGKKIIKIINKYQNNKFIRIHKNLLHKDFLAMMKYATAIIGNSSSAIIEAPYLNLPAVNIGSREEGRERGGNVFDVDYDSGKIVQILRSIISNPSIKEQISKKYSPYNPGATKNIVRILENLKFDSNLIVKRMTY